MPSLPGTSPFLTTPTHLFARQNIADQARTTLSSWDNCMAKSYCKWPVIAIIIVGSLIILSILLCIVRCCCCGLECCFGCCACCNACCPSPRGKRRGKYEQVAPPQPLPPQAYGYAPQMNYGYSPQPTPQPAPQFATFESSGGKVKDDALPIMPSWQTSTKKQVEDTSYHGAEETGIALDAVSPNGRKIKDDVPIREQLYEDPVEQPMLRQHSPAPLHSPYRAASPYQEDPHAYVSSPPPQQQQQQQQQQQRYQSPPPQQQYQQSNHYAQSEYSEAENPYDGVSVAGTDYSHPQPQHSYGMYNQTTHTGYSNQGYGNSGYGNSEPRSPTSMYSSSQYPPAYTSRAPSLAQRQQPYRQPQQQQQQPYRAFSPELSTAYEPSSKGVPDILSPGGGAGHYSSEYHELGGGQGISRKPVN